MLLQLWLAVKFSPAGILLKSPFFYPELPMVIFEIKYIAVVILYISLQAYQSPA